MQFVCWPSPGLGHVYVDSDTIRSDVNAALVALSRHMDYRWSLTWNISRDWSLAWHLLTGCFIFGWFLIFSFLFLNSSSACNLLASSSSFSCCRLFSSFSISYRLNSFLLSLSASSKSAAAFKWKHIYKINLKFLETNLCSFALWLTLVTNILLHSPLFQRHVNFATIR